MYNWFKCPKCNSQVDYDYDESTIPTDDELWDAFAYAYNDNPLIMKGELWCTKCQKRYNFEEHWCIKMDSFKTEEIQY